MILVIDNYDSFTYNLVQLLGTFTNDIAVRRNDEMGVEEMGKLNLRGIVISPGPGRPEEAGITVDVIRRFGHIIPILGVCLGHQAIGIAFGGKVVHAPSLMHGKTSRVRHDGTAIYAGIESPFVATRYHSLVVAPDGFPEGLLVTATTDDGVIMGVRHKEYPLEGVQYHPESILTVCGRQLIANWLKAHRCL